jgi:hypothetical protein
MSRRISLFVLAASAALIATQAAADPECFGDSCRLPEVVDPPVATIQPPEADEPAALEASAAVPKFVPAKTLPQMTADETSSALPKLAPSKAVSSMAVDPVMRIRSTPLPPASSGVEEASAPTEPARLAPRYAKATPAPAPAPLPAAVPAISPAPANHARPVRVSSPDPGYVLGYNQVPAAGIVVVVPGAYHAAGVRPVYMIAPSAKIISIDTDD